MTQQDGAQTASPVDDITIPTLPALPASPELEGILEDELKDFASYYRRHTADYSEPSTDLTSLAKSDGSRNPRHDSFFGVSSIGSEPGSPGPDRVARGSGGSGGSLLRFDPGSPPNIGLGRSLEATNHAALEAEYEKAKGEIVKWHQKWEEERLQHQRTWDACHGTQLELDRIRGELQRAKGELVAHRKAAAARAADEGSPEPESPQFAVVAEYSYQTRIDALLKELKESQNLASYWQDQAQKDRAQHGTTWSMVKTLEEELSEAKNRILQLEAGKGVAAVGKETSGTSNAHVHYRDRQASITGVK